MWEGCGGSLSVGISQNVSFINCKRAAVVKVFSNWRHKTKTGTEHNDCADKQIMSTGTEHRVIHI